MQLLLRPTLEPHVELDLFPHMHGAVNWNISKLHPEASPCHIAKSPAAAYLL